MESEMLSPSPAADTAKPPETSANSSAYSAAVAQQRSRKKSANAVTAGATTSLWDQIALNCRTNATTIAAVRTLVTTVSVFIA